MNDYQNAVPYPLMIAFRSDVLLLRSDCKEGVYLDGDTASAYIRFFTDRFQEAPPFARLHSNLKDFLECWNREKIDDSEYIYSILRSPSMVLTASTSVTKSHMIENSLYNQFMFMFQHTIVNQACIYSCFWEDGITDLLYSDEYYEYDKKLSTSLSRKERRYLFRNWLTAGRAAAEFNCGIFRSECPKNTNLFGINIWSGGRILLLLNDETRYYIVTMHEPQIVQDFIRMLELMQRHGLLLSKEETLRFCEEKLKEADGQ